MQIEIIAIADEILSGSTINTNASFMSRELSKKGYIVNRHNVFSDEIVHLEKGLNEVFTRVDLAIVCGGLGPTMDDRTKSVICKLFDTALEVEEKIQKKLTLRCKNFENIAAIQEQSSVPVGAISLYNEIGTAPGLILKRGKKHFIFLPGVPSELKPMFLKDVLPFIEKSFSLQRHYFEREIHFCRLAEVQIDQYLQTLSTDVQFGIYPALGTVRLVMKKQVENAEAVEQSFSEIEELLKKEFYGYIFDAKNGLIEEAIHREFKKKKATLSIAESCSGGSISKKITSLEGASEFFLGSIVCYSNESKENLLQVSSEKLKKFGAVSKEVVEQMLKGLLHTFSSEYAIATSGIAGPLGGTKEKPVGTVYIGIAKKNGFIRVEKFNFQKNRQRIIEATANYALSMLYRNITYNL